MPKRNCSPRNMLVGRKLLPNWQRVVLVLTSSSLPRVEHTWTSQLSVSSDLSAWFSTRLTLWLGHPASVSGGEIYFYPNFHAPRDVLKLSRELAHTVNRETGYQALMKVRCSNGLQVAAYHGNFLQHTFGADLEIGAIDADKAFGVLFTYDGKLDVKLDAHFQAALLYTTASGQRRVRCINIVAAVNDGGLETMRFVDQDAVVAIIAKEGRFLIRLDILFRLTLADT